MQLLKSAGHETTSGLLSFTSYYLLKNPEAMRKAQDEVDRVIGTGPVQFQHMSKLPYIEAVLRESLRLSPTAPAFSVTPLGKEPEVIGGGKYLIPAGQSIACFLPAAGRDTSVFGADADEFRPERMLGDNFTKLPRNAWKPFGNGARGCIGRPFAWQEAILALSLILQNFNLRMDDSTYHLKIKQTLTIKPDGFQMRATLRDGIDPIGLEKKMFSGVLASEKSDRLRPTTTVAPSSGEPMTILYGSNSGTCEGLAQTLAGAAGAHGYRAIVKSLDAAVDQLPTGQHIIIITASYEGNPPDNAGQFVEWLKTVDDSKIKGSNFAVFGCGHRDWVSTFHKIPKLIDQKLGDKGGNRITGMGASDVAQGTVFDDFDTWLDEGLWPAISQKSSSSADVDAGLDMELRTSTRASHLHHGVQDAQVLENHLLRKPGQPDARHMTFKLPTNTAYEAGDYLAVLPINPIATISRVLRRFGLPFDATMTLKKGANTTIPTEQELGVTAVLGAYVELSNTATKKNITTIAKYAEAEKIDFVPESPSPNAPMSVLDILERHPKINIPFAVFMSMLTPMRIRQYSISSSPLADPTVASVSFAVVENPNADETGTPHLGVATNYLKSLQPGSIVQLSVKKSHKSFKLPLDDEDTPIIMVAAGTGIAPFRGFVQERVEKVRAGKKLAEAVLFFGCRNDGDILYKDLFAEWENRGAVKVYYAFSRDSDRTEGCRYAQDRVWKEKEEVVRLFSQGARAYICGNSRLGKGVAEVAVKIAMEGQRKKGEEMTLEEGLGWWERLRGERFAVDVFD
jgi:cytochrome P450 / NADPH-cytochrome P450 reductase